MSTNKLVGFFAAMALALLAVDSAEAFYHAGMGRFLNRDPGGIGVMSGSGVTGARVVHTPGHPFIERDASSAPGYIDGYNLYQYVRSDPASGMDPFGLATIDCHFTGGRNGGKWSKTIQVDCQGLASNCCASVRPGGGRLTGWDRTGALPSPTATTWDVYKPFWDCWSNCMKCKHKEAAVYVAGGLISAETLAYTHMPIPKPEGMRWPGTGPNTTFLRLDAYDLHRKYGKNNWRYRFWNNAANQAKRAPIRAGLKAGLVGVAWAEAGVSWYCSVECSNKTGLPLFGL